MKHYMNMILQFGVFVLLFTMVFSVFDYYGDDDQMTSNLNFAFGGLVFVVAGLVIDIFIDWKSRRKS